MRVVLDTNVVISAMRSPAGVSAALLRLVLNRQIISLVSVPLSLEYEEKCMEHAAKAGLTTGDAIALFQAIVAVSEKVENHFLWRPSLPDPDDEMVLETAVNGRADAIISYNYRDFGHVPASLNIAVLTPPDAIWRFYNV